jgi:(E)-4-hydroxy-3-methylbut-2-enyl-diphosphate synthase
MHRMSFKRRDTLTVRIGSVAMGSGAPVAVQSMTNTDTADIEGTVSQVKALARAGSELVRVTVNSDEAAAAVPHIRDRLAQLGIDVPLIGDFHFNGHKLLTRRTRTAPPRWRQVPHQSRQRGPRREARPAVRRDDRDRLPATSKPVRIGVNWGSLDSDLLDAADGREQRAAPSR